MKRTKVLLRDQHKLAKIQLLHVLPVKIVPNGIQLRFLAHRDRLLDSGANMQKPIRPASTKEPSGARPIDENVSHTTATDPADARHAAMLGNLRVGYTESQGGTSSGTRRRCRHRLGSSRRIPVEISLSASRLKNRCHCMCGY